MRDSIRGIMGDYEVEESVISEPCDRLSELPDSLILDILSLLPMRDVVSTTILSKRWNNLWTTVPCLDFCEIRDENEEERVRNFVNSALKLWKGTKIEKFKFNYSPHFDMSLASDIDSWVQFAVEHKVEVLEIRLWYDREEVEWRDPAMTGKKGVYRAPLCLNSCSSIRELCLVGCNLRIGGPPAWSQLKSLRISGCFSERTISRILLGSPCLQVFELCLLDRYENLNIRSGSLRKLVIEKNFHFLDDSPSLDAVLRICCPNLETLEISGVIYPKYLFTNVSSLTDVTLLGYEEPFYLKSPEIELLGESLRHILPAIQHVEKVTLSAWCVQVLGASQKKYLLSPLPNVKTLKLTVHSKEIGNVEFCDLMNLLGIFSNLKMLVIEDPPCLNDMNQPTFDEEYSEFGTNLSESYLMHLRTIQITSAFYSSSILGIVEFLLKHASKLEKLVVGARWCMSYRDVFCREVVEYAKILPNSKGDCQHRLIIEVIFLFERSILIG